MEDANKVIEAVLPAANAWDWHDRSADDEGRAIFARLRELFGNSQHISSAWIVNEKGVSILDTWKFPSEPFDGSARPYFRKHLEGAQDPLILADERPGVVSLQRRFAFSKAIKGPDGHSGALLWSAF